MLWSGTKGELSGGSSLASTTCHCTTLIRLPLTCIIFGHRYKFRYQIVSLMFRPTDSIKNQAPLYKESSLVSTISRLGKGVLTLSRMVCGTYLSAGWGSNRPNVERVMRYGSSLHSNEWVIISARDASAFGLKTSFWHIPDNISWCCGIRQSFSILIFWSGNCVGPAAGGPAAHPAILGLQHLLTCASVPHYFCASAPAHHTLNVLSTQYLYPFFGLAVNHIAQHHGAVKKKGGIDPQNHPK